MSADWIGEKEAIERIANVEYGYTKYKLNQLTEEGLYEITSYIKDLKDDFNIKEVKNEI